MTPERNRFSPFVVRYPLCPGIEASVNFLRVVAIASAILSGAGAAAQVGEAPRVIIDAPGDGELRAKEGGPGAAVVPPPPTAPANKPPIPEWQRKSGQRAGGPASQLNTGDARAEEKLPGGSVSGALSGRELYHGAFCGHGAAAEGAQPVDDLDAACMRHDQCYDAARYRSCACDEALKREAVAIADGISYSRELRARAASIAEAAELMQCQRP